MKHATSTAIPAGLLSLISFLNVQPLLAQTPYALVFTEQPNGQLIESVNGIDLTPSTWTIIQPGVWQNTAFAQFGSPIGGTNQFIEPSGEAGYNQLVGVFAFSDSTTSFPVTTTYPLGTPEPYDSNGTLNMMYDASGKPVPATFEFVDNGDSPTVPDASATLPLCGFACLSVVAMRRYLAPHTVAV